jgi:hypothetical protein
MTLEFGRLDSLFAVLPSLVCLVDQKQKFFEIGIYFLKFNLSLKISLK